MISTQKKNYLEAYAALNKSIIQDIDKIMLIKNQVRKYSVNTKGVSDGTQLKEKEALKNILVIQSIINKKIETLVELRLKIEWSASQLEDRRLSLLIKYRYIDGLEWSEISEKLYLSNKSNQVFVLHNKALSEIVL